VSDNTFKTFFFGVAIAVVAGIVLFLLLPSSDATPSHWHTGLIVIIIVFSAFYWTYYTFLGYQKSEINSDARASYNRLRSNLIGRKQDKAKDSRFGERYKKAVEQCLDSVDYWLGEAVPEQHTWSSRLLKLNNPKPLWTKASYDRCLLLTLLYPLLSLIAVWTFTGEVGPVETALKLSDAVQFSERILFTGALVLIVFFITRLFSPSNKSILLWLIATSLAFIVVVTVTDFGVLTGVGVIAGAIVVGFASGASLPGSGVSAGAFAVAAAIAFSLAFAVVGVVSWNSPGASSIAFAVAAAFLFSISYIASSQQFRITLYLQPLFFWGLLVFLILVSSLLILTISQTSWESASPILLFFGVLVIANAPLDWLTLGVTRGLLRRGIETGRWWPLIYGFLDLLIAFGFLLLLLIIMLFAIQGFNALAATQGASAFLVPKSVLTGMSNPDTRFNPEYWWIYFTLFSTMLPSFINLIVGVLCILRGIPWLNDWFGRLLPQGSETKAMLPTVRVGLAAALAGHLIVSVILAAAVLYGLFCLIFKILPPTVLPYMLSVAQHVVEHDWPRQGIFYIADLIRAII